jgi:competence protein ComEC
MRDFRIFFFKVGNGHCSYIEFPNGKNGLIYIKVIHQEKYDDIIDVLKAAKIGRLDYLFITHPHRDHIEGLDEIVENFSIGQFICSPVNFIPDPIYDSWNVYEEMRVGNYCEKVSEVTEGWYTEIGNTRIDYIAPRKELLEDYPDDINNNGLILRVECRGHQIIIPGDTEKECWERITNSQVEGTTLLLAAHHGNNSGYHLEKIKAMNLAFAVISAGPKTEHDADEKYRNQVRKGIYSTRQKRIVSRIDEKNILHMIS